MPWINRAVPNAETLLAMEPEEAAEVLLPLAAEDAAERNGVTLLQTIGVFYSGDPSGPSGLTPYPRTAMSGIHRVMVEGWQWLRNNLLLVQKDESGPWLQLTRRAESIIKHGGFADYRRAMDFPKSLLHPAIADKVWTELARGDVEDAVFAAFKRLEIAVREASGYTSAEHGVPMMRKAFDPNNGPLTDLNQEAGEREALAHLFAGAHGSYKNPVSHRTVTVGEVREAQEMVMLASHLLRIVDARAKRRVTPNDAR